MQVFDVISAEAAFGIGLDDNATNLVAVHEVTDVAGTEHDSQGIADFRDGNSHGECFFSVDGNAEARGVGLPGKVYAGEVGACGVGLGE